MAGVKSIGRYSTKQRGSRGRSHCISAYHQFQYNAHLNSACEDTLNQTDEIQSREEVHSAKA